MSDLVPVERIYKKIYMIRGEKVMLDRDLAELYEVETKRLKEQVRRNPDRFPEDFMFTLTQEEFTRLRSQFATSKRGGTRYKPMAFTEHGIAMLSNVLNSKRAVQVSIYIIRAFIRLRKVLSTNAEIKQKIEDMERKYDRQFKVVFDVLKQVMAPEKKKVEKIGF